ncbi:MAG: amidohydrolase [Planctomycetota bacterium]|nr:MAG: amidohydrolase [Planctomycetota bacterium]
MLADNTSKEIYEALIAIPILDPHSHINPHAAASKSLEDILGYHYYTELAHSCGMDKKFLAPEVPGQDKVREIIRHMNQFDNTAQYSWFLEIAQTFLDFKGDRILPKDTDYLWNTAQKKMSDPSWETQVLKISNLEKIFLTNDFDDPLDGFNTSFYIPCLRTDELVFHFPRNNVRNRLEKISGINPGNASELTKAFHTLFKHFTQKGARACAISLPPDFSPAKVSDAALDLCFKSSDFDSPTWKNGVFWKLAEACNEWKLPFDLMIGVNRNVYQEGVFQGKDLYDQRTSLIQYAPLFNSFPTVTFCVSVLTSNQNQELASYSWIFPNVVTHGHWWYSNIPTHIEQDTRARLQAVPKTKQIGYYSDMYKLEFGLPKFNMYRKILSNILSKDFVQTKRSSINEAVDLGKLLLRGNSETIFKMH